MKYLNLLLISILISSCCGTKRVTKTTSENIAQVSQASDSIDNEEKSVNPITIKQAETLKPPESQLSEHVEDVDKNETIEAFNHNKYSELLQKYVTSNGKVDYRGFKNDAQLLRSYIASLGEHMPDETWNKADKLAFWMNAYNALTIDLILRNYPIKSIKDIDNPWEQRLWKLGSKWYNLEEIEHQILRKMNEPRIHFGIVCASFSCPKLMNEAFSANNLEAQLTRATREFLADPNRNNISENIIKLSKIFSWFGKDFKQEGSLIDFLNKYSKITIASNAKKSFKEYNWDLNE